MPKISVIVPVYKVEKYLCRCIDSVLNQTFTDFEIVLVDDGSPDNCGKICDEYAEKDDRVTVIHQKNGGLSAARNSGLDWVAENSDSEWITFIDSDDWIHHQYLELLYFSVAESGSEIAICNLERIEKYTENEIVFDKKYELLDTENFYCSDVIVAAVACCKLYKKEFFKSIRFPVGYIHEDEFTIYKILFQSKKVCYIEYPLYMYFQNESGIMRTAKIKEKIKAYTYFSEQKNFFANNGFDLAYKKTVGLELQYLYWLFIDNNEKIGYKKEKKWIKKRLQRFLIRNRRDYPINKKAHLYKLAFKNIYRLCCFCAAIKNKLKNIK